MAGTTPEDQYNNVCKAQFAEILNEMRGIGRRLFKDNGNICLQTKIDRNTRWIHGFAAVLTVVGLGIFGLLLWVIKIWIATQVVIPAVQ